MPKRTISKIALRLIVATILFSSLITLINTGWQLYAQYDRDIETIENHLEEIETVYLSSIATRIWVADKAEMRSQLNGLLNMRDIVYLQVTEQGKVWVTAGVMQAENKIERSYPIYYMHRGKNLHIGDLTVQSSLEGVYRNLVNEVWNILVGSGIKTFLVAGFMFLIFQYLVTRHLYKIAEFAKKLTIENLDSRLTLDRKNKNRTEDELDTVVNALESMQVNLAKSLKDIKEREYRLSIYEKIMSTSSDQMAFLDRNYTYLAVNQAYCNIFGKSYEEIVNHTVTDLLGTEYFTEVVKHRLDKVFQGERFVFESIVKHQDKAVPVEITYIPYYGGSKEVQGAVVNVRNITERVRHNQIYHMLARTPAIDISLFLKDSLQCLAEVFDAKFAMVGRVNKNRTEVTSDALYMNNQIVDNVTYSLEGTPCREVINTGPKLVTENASKLFPKDDLLTELSIECYIGSPLINTHGETVGLVVVMDDKPREQTDWYEETMGVVAARIAMEIEHAEAILALDEHSKNLEAEVKTRTADLQQMYNELETFSYTVSHDLRTPLRAINGFAHVLIEDKAELLDDESRLLLKKINLASEKMAGLIDSLLALSRIRRHELEIRNVDVTRMCNEIVADLVDTFEMDRVSLEIQDDLKTKGDPSLLKIVLENLIKNALKFSADREKPEIKIGKLNNNKSVIYIQDNGIGFDMTYKDSLFKPFQRLHNGIKYQGHGIGLATVFRIIERHGGKIWADSAIDKGTTIFFELPNEA